MAKNRRVGGVPTRPNPGTLVALVLAAVYFLVPLWWLIVSSTKSNSDLFNTAGFWFAENNFFENLSRVFEYENGVFPRWVVNSILYCGTAALWGTIMATAAGYVLAKFEFRGRGFISGAVLVGVMVPGALLTIPMYFLASSANLVNTPWAIIIPASVSPFGVYLARAYAATAIPDELLEAARVDGAGELRIFFQMVLRLVSPSMVTVFLFIFVGAWNNFMLALVMLNDQKLYPLTLGLYSWQNQKGVSNYEIVLAGSLVSIIPLMIAFFALQKYWRTGIADGGVKG